MGKTYSPLRYPGGKSSTYPMVSSIIKGTFTEPCRYYEPYAGGGGLALALLFSEDVKEIHLNDLDKSIWSLWDAMLNNTDELIKLITKTPITIDEWHIQKEIQSNRHKYDNLQIAFSTFFLNRTNRSGIILKAGVIGGLLQLNERYPLHCRFNKVDLIQKIKKIASFKSKINLYNMDAMAFLRELDTKNVHENCFFIDPPYFEKGASLYTNFYEKEDHAEIAKTIKSLQSKWMLTYDNAPEIKELYNDEFCYEFHLNYSLAKKRKGTELFVHKGMNIPDDFLNTFFEKKV